jgi:trigger factor
MSTSYTITKEEKKDGSQIELTIEVAKAILEKERESSIKELSADVELKGFRKGKVPQDLVIKEVGEARIFERSAYRVINDIYIVLLEKGDYNVITHPEISVTKLAPGNDLEFKMVLTTAPEITLPDYKKIAQTVKKETDLAVSDTELDEHIAKILTQHAQMQKQMKHTHKDGEACADCKVEGDANKEKAEIDTKEGVAKKEAPLPELTDELVQKFGDFKTVTDFKKSLTESLTEEKKNQANQKRRTEIIEGIINVTKVDVPEILIDAELDRMLAQLESDVSRMGLNKEQYLQAIQKTEDDIKKEWRDDGKKRAIMNLVLPNIAKAEKIVPEKDAIQKEADHIKEHHMKDSDSKIDDLQLQVYVASVMTNEKVFEFLETL